MYTVVAIKKEELNATTVARKDNKVSKAGNLLSTLHSLLVFEAKAVRLLPEKGSCERSVKNQAEIRCD